MRPLPFRTVWVATDLGDFRPCDSTYCRYDGLTLPSLPQHLFNGTYSWLRRHPSPLEYDKRFAGAWGNDAAVWNDGAERNRTLLLSAASACGITLPDAFMRFLFDRSLVTMLRSPTDCYFHRPVSVIESAGSVPGHFVHFLSDSQNCYEWYLFIDSKGNHCVVATWEMLNEPSLPATFWDNRRDEIVACADSFEAFIYRLWIENEIWFRDYKKDQPFTEEMRAYAAASRDTAEIDS
jgi:hypothetical protein